MMIASRSIFPKFLQVAQIVFLAFLAQFVFSLKWRFTKFILPVFIERTS